ncbi:uncharacterized protein LOC126893815 [Daktulosphaira vitifoliae]|uniref:uncharacterized protein LOC126893815 n=1 Tax=Daktulosphaira vitifoliae TaxID=58002 RepID=UPI0021AA2E27|nr:uncharacterized protein LOC126893815 [Daktulosphaira vitifoliae]
MTIQKVEETSLPPARLCNLFKQEIQPANPRNSNYIFDSQTHSSLTTSWIQRNNRLKLNNRALNSCKAAIDKLEMQKLLSCNLTNETVTEDHLNVMRKRQALLLITMQTMTLSHHNKILQHKLDELHKRVLMLRTKQKNSPNELESD